MVTPTIENSFTVASRTSAAPPIPKTLSPCGPGTVFQAVLRGRGRTDHAVKGAAVQNELCVPIVIFTSIVGRKLFMVIGSSITLAILHFVAATVEGAPRSAAQPISTH